MQVVAPKPALQRTARGTPGVDPLVDPLQDPLLAAPVQRTATGAGVVQRIGLDTDDLAREVFAGAKKVALVGENHGETISAAEKQYFETQGYGYHTEISSYTNAYSEDDDTLTAEHDADDFAVENMAWRALDQVLDLAEHYKDFPKEYITPITRFFADGYQITHKMDQLVNPKMLGKLAKKLHLLKHEFVTTTLPAAKEDAHLFLGPLHATCTELEATQDALDGTSWEERATQVEAAFGQAYVKFLMHDLLLDNAMDGLEDAEDFDGLEVAIQQLETFHEEMDGLIPKVREFLVAVIAAQAPNATSLAGAGTGDADGVRIGRSEAMINSAAWLSKNTQKTGEVVKVGDLHIDDMENAVVDAPDLVIIGKDDYYGMQDRTNTAALRK